VSAHLVIYKYSCEKTGLTYSVDNLRSSDESVPEGKTKKLEIPCPKCGGRHALTVEKREEDPVAESSLERAPVRDENAG
jgi:hypothetical protein